MKGDSGVMTHPQKSKPKSIVNGSKGSCASVAKCRRSYMCAENDGNKVIPLDQKVDQ